MRVEVFTILLSSTLAAAALPAVAQEAPATAEERPAAAEATAPAASAEETAPADRVVAATAADLRAGAEVRDAEGGMVGTVQSADAEGAVVTTGRTLVRLPLSSFGKNRAGLVISMTRTELEAAAAARSGS